MSECFDCKKMYHKCKAECCGTIPFPKETWDKNQDKIVQEIHGTLVFPAPDGEYITITTKSDMCVFLKEDFSCNIYKDRPPPCIVFGTEKLKYMTCPFQDKSGKERSRQSRRKIQRNSLKLSIGLRKRANNKETLNFINDNFKKWE